MKTILISLFAAGATTVAVIGPEFDFQNKGRGKDKDKSESTSRDHSRDTSAGTRWTKDTRPPSVPEPSSPIVLLTAAGFALLMRRTRK